MKIRRSHIISVCLIAMVPLLARDTVVDNVATRFIPPPVFYHIKGGSCGEACLWSVLNARGITITQEEINRAGGAPGRGLYSHELFKVLAHYKVPYLNLSQKTADYRALLYKSIIPSLKKGSAVLLGVKIYPDQYPQWACDHFILLVRYNEKTGEILFNDFEKRKKQPVSWLLDTDFGYSIVSRHGYVFALAFD